MTLELAFDLVLGVAWGLLGMLYKSILSRLERIEEQNEKLAEQISFILRDYPTRRELQTDINHIEKQVERILDKLDRKADK